MFQNGNIVCNWSSDFKVQCYLRGTSRQQERMFNSVIHKIDSTWERNPLLQMGVSLHLLRNHGCVELEFCKPVGDGSYYLN